MLGTNILETSDNKAQEEIDISGILEIIDNEDSFIRLASNNYNKDVNDPYMSDYQIEKFGLRAGDIIDCKVLPPKNDNSKKGNYYRFLVAKLCNLLYRQLVIRTFRFDNQTYKDH